MTERLKVAVLFGGRSGEHEVSIMSARSVMRALDPEKYEAIPVGITRQGRWLIGADPLKALESEDFTGTQSAAIFADPSRQGLWADTAAHDASANSLAAVAEQPGTMETLASLSRVDVVFPVLHGTFGEDGTVQGLLELAGVPYVGGGVLNSALAMDKIAFKDVAKARGLPITAYVWTTRRQWQAEPEAVMDEVERKLGYPAFTKPANLGSSVGITKCHDRRELRQGLEEAARYDRRILAEWAVPDAREIEVSVIGNEEPSASLPGEIIPSREFYDYTAKYLDHGEEASELLIPAPLDEATTQKVQMLAIEAYRAIDGTGMARVDFLLSRATGELYLNEINTIPGFTAISMYPKLWEASGVSYSHLLDWLIDLALERHDENARSERVFRPIP
ncbi:MAG TPA: D-alanine--D-alanine ligase family protein [Anaerolineae bacterium]|nr:D-alanine--D-alanine ligase family protein [Anaerolineae bacterium]HQH38640.1 D-alanine--D-alanine ligase family protein [Anaerolineae bacterium]